MSFNTKEIYINKEATNNTSNKVLDLNELESSIVETNSNITNPNATKISANKDSQGLNKASKQDIVTYFIENTFTDAQLDEVTTKLKSHGITLKIKGVKRNSDNKITALKIDDNLSSLSILSKLASLLFQRGVLFATPAGEPVIMAAPFVSFSLLYVLKTKPRISLFE